MSVKYQVVQSEKLSHGKRKRWVIVDSDTGEVLEDSQGYGFKTEDSAKFFAANKAVRVFLGQHPNVRKVFEDRFYQMILNECEHEINEKLVQSILNEMGCTDVPFTPSEFLRYAGLNL